MIQAASFARRIGAIALILASSVAPIGADASPVQHVWYSDQDDTTLRCPALFECTLSLAPGEQITDAYSADIPDWDPHDMYGPHNTPALLFRPSRPGLRTNVVVTTTEHVYHLYLISTADREPAYYEFRFPSQNASGGNVTGAAFHGGSQNGVGNAETVAPAAAVDLASANLADLCNRDGYRVDAHPANWLPELVCNDGHHTFIQFSPYHTTPTDSPIIERMVDDGSGTMKPALVNYTPYMAHGRIVVDGVYDNLVMLVDDKAMRIQRFQSDGSLLTPQSTMRTTPSTPAPATPTAQSGSFAKGGSQLVVAMTKTPHGVEAVTDTAEEAQGASPSVPPTTVAPTGTQEFVGGRALSGPQYLQEPSSVPAGCPAPNPNYPNSGWDTNTSATRDVKFGAQILDAFVVATAIKHGAIAHGIFGAFSSPWMFLFSQGVEDVVLHQGIKHACPRAENVENLLVGGSAIFNAIRSH